MVKEFDIGVSAQAWVLLDMDRRSHLGEPPDNTEELAVTVAASLVQHWDETAVPVGLAANSADLWMLNPDRRPAQLGILMETLAGIRADGTLSLERFIYDLRPHLSGFNTLMVITASRRPEWTSALVSLRRQGINVTVCYVDHTSFTRPRRRVEHRLHRPGRRRVPGPARHTHLHRAARRGHQPGIVASAGRRRSQGRPRASPLLRIQRIPPAPSR